VLEVGPDTPREDIPNTPREDIPNTPREDVKVSITNFPSVL